MLPKRYQALPNVAKTASNVVQCFRTHASSLNLRTFKTSRRRQATCLQRCNNVAQKLPDVVQQWYNLVISWATHHNVAQHYRVSSAPSTTLPHTTQTFANVAKLQPNVFQRCQNTCQAVASFWTCVHLERLTERHHEVRSVEFRTIHTQRDF